jgi:hypothetical protein
MTLEHLDKMDQCRNLLPDPAPEVVGELINDLRRYVKAMDAIYNHNEAVRAAEKMTALDLCDPRDSSRIIGTLETTFFG